MLIINALVAYKIRKKTFELLKNILFSLVKHSPRFRFISSIPYYFIYHFRRSLTILIMHIIEIFGTSSLQHLSPAFSCIIWYMIVWTNPIYKKSELQNFWSFSKAIEFLKIKLYSILVLNMDLISRSLLIR